MHIIWEPTNMLVGIPTFYLPIMSNPCWGPRLYLSIYLPIMSKTQPPAGDLDFIYLSIYLKIMSKIQTPAGDLDICASSCIIYQ